MTQPLTCPHGHPRTGAGRRDDTATLDVTVCPVCGPAPAAQGGTLDLAPAAPLEGGTVNLEPPPPQGGTIDLAPPTPPEGTVQLGPPAPQEGTIDLAPPAAPTADNGDNTFALAGAAPPARPVHDATLAIAPESLAPADPDATLGDGPAAPATHARAGGETVALPAASPPRATDDQATLDITQGESPAPGGDQTLSQEEAASLAASGRFSDRTADLQTGGPRAERGQQTELAGRQRTVGDVTRGGGKAQQAAVPGYEILSELGRGGMGVVYKARQKGLGRLVALKMVLNAGHASSDQLARFRVEAEAIAQLQHPHIVQVFEVGENEGLPFFSLEFVDGQSLQDKIDGTPQAARDAADMVRLLAEAMHAAHTRGIIHRDLKPANVLLTKAGQPKITDFGLAKRFEDRDHGQTRTGAIMGTPSYMAPEQAAGGTKDTGPAADIYSLGAVLYDLLTGRPPFRGTTVLETLQLVQRADPVPLARLQLKVPRDLETICLKCLEKEPAKRYASAGDLAADLGRFLAGEPIKARPTPAWERALKWARRRPAVATLVGVSFVAFVSLLTLGALWLDTARRAAEEREQAAEQRERQQARLAEMERERAREEARLRAEADRQRGRAEANFQQARAAVDQMLTRVGHERLAHEPRMEKIRHELLERALAFYQRFLQVKGDDPAIRHEAGRAQQRVADIREMLGQHALAEKAYREAQDVFVRLAEKYPSRPEYARDLAAGYNNLGNLLRETGRAADAEKAYRQALDLQGRLALATPNDRKEQAMAHNNLGRVLQDLGRPADAEAAYREGARLLRGLADQAPREPEYRRELARARDNLGRLYVAMSRTAQAEAALKEAADLFGKLAAEKPDVPDYRQDLAMAHQDLGDLWRDTDPAKAEAAYLTARTLRQTLATDFPTVPVYRQELAVTLGTLGVLLQAAGKQAEADKTYSEGLALRERLARDFPKLPEFRRNLGSAYNNRGILLQTHNRLADAGAAYERAGEIFRELSGQYPDVPDYQQELAGVYLNRAVLHTAAGQVADAEKSCRDALDVQQALAKRYPQATYRHELARIHLNLGGILLAGGDGKGAEKAFRSAVRGFKALAAENPRVPDYRHQLAVARNNLGNVLRDFKRPQEAEKVWRESLGTLEALTAELPQVPIYRQELGRGLNEFGIFLAVTNRAKAAEEAWQKAAGVQGKLVADWPARADYRQELARSQGNLGILLAQGGQAAKAADAYRRAVTLLEELEPKLAVTPAYTRDLITTHTNLAGLLKAIGRGLEAEKSEVRVLELREKLAAAYPKVAQYRLEAAQTLGDFAARYLKGDKQREAADHARRAVAQMEACRKLRLRGLPAVQALYDVHLLVMDTLTGVGDHAGAAGVAQEAAQIFGPVVLAGGPQPRRDSVRLAAALARCAGLAARDDKLPEAKRKELAQEYGDRAVEFVRKAAREGYRDAQHLRTAPDFAALRARDDFQRLLEGMETPRPKGTTSSSR